MLFLDADDTVFPALGTLARALAGQVFDLAILTPAGSPCLRQGLQGPDGSLDRAIRADLAPGPDPRPLTPIEARALCRISNDPWTRIWWRAVLSAAQVRCTAPPLHKDIEPHWAAFVSARHLLVSDAACVPHQVAPGSGQP